MDKFYLFRRLIDFIADDFNVTDADMNNYAGEMEIVGTDADGSTVTVRVIMKEAEKDGD